MAGGRAASAPPGSSAVNKELRHPLKAFKNTINSGPTFSMRAKTSFGVPQPTATEPGGDLSGKLDSVLKKSPSWSMTSRAVGIPSPPSQPGPGEYPLPSTLCGSHPTLVCPGRVHKPTAPRPDFIRDAAKKDIPSPADYQNEGSNRKLRRADQSAPPSYTMRAKLSDPADREPRPGFKLLGNATHKGVQNTPSWSMPPRASGIPKPHVTPGPGQYPIPGSIYGSHPMIQQPGRVAKKTGKRFTYPEPDDRPF
mmetsp:Transcript_44930/g.88918  ORF Transcript_44930/g.88918 Transcript_44930/m.88918 type:complete len:252 (+) Transcript_44930:127-882(+)